MNPPETFLKRLAYWWWKCGFLAISLGQIDDFEVGPTYLIVRLRSWVIGCQVSLYIKTKRVNERMREHYKYYLQEEMPPFKPEISFSVSRHKKPIAKIWSIL